MDEALYQQFLDWLRRRDDHVTLRLEDGTVLLRALRARNVFEEDSAARKRSGTRVIGYTLGYLRKQYGADVDKFLATLP